MTTAFRLADDLVDEFCAMSPILSTHLGLAGSDDRWGDSFGLAGLEAARELRERYVSRLDPLTVSADPRERLAARVMMGSMAEARRSYEHGDHFRDLRHLASPFHSVRSVFDVMRTATAEDCDHIVARLETSAQPLEDYIGLLQAGISAGVVVAQRQVRSVINQARRMSGDPASIDAIVEKVEASGHGSARLAAAAGTARAAIGEFAEWLETGYLPHAVEEDAVGGDTYIRAADRLVGLETDPDEAYEWGWDEFHRLLGELGRVGDEISPGQGVDAVKHYLETDPAVTAAGTDPLIVFVEQILARAVDDLAGSHFEVPQLIRPLTVQLAPPGSPLGVYYVRPSEDFTRPGGVWYSIGDQEVFPLYQHVSTAYHEGFPGHHLQIATAMSRSEEISRFQRVLTWYPGYGEGWGMYAEVLMGELGYLDDPQHYFGMLAKQMYRAARVVVDIGLHLGKGIPPSSPIAPGEQWSFDNAVEFMRVYGFRTEDQARDEVLRYLGWPGQAITYKLGEREILSIRDETKTRLGSAFDLKEFHSTVLNHGAMRLDLLREVVAERLGS
ncbi:MAG: DUF885 domain-containing protein [Acidimicrobiia bacterium]